MKAYICNPDKTLEVPGENSKMILEFDPAPENAATWKGKGVAEEQCRIFNSTHFAADGAEYKNFGVEERIGQFVVFCDATRRAEG